MKNSILYLISISFAVLLLASCSKETNTNRDITNDQQYTTEEMALWNKLNNFNQKIKYGLKSEEFISPDSAIWYLEALLNVQHATDTSFDDVVTFRKNYQLQKNTDGTVSMSHVVDVYNILVGDLKDQLASLESEYKFLIIADLPRSMLKSEDLEIELTAGLGINPLVVYEPITVNDNWKYGNMLGRCDGSYFGQSDAGQELKRRFNNPEIALPFPHNAWINPYVSDILTSAQFPGRIFYEIASSTPCIEYDELETYLIQGHYLIYNTSTQSPLGVRPEGLYFRTLDLWTNNPNPSDNIYWHKYLIWYGTPVNIPPVED